MSNSNSMVAHLWANQSKLSARSSNGNFSFEGLTIYSYRTPIAVMLDGAILRTSRRYSKTTSCKHEPAVSRAINGDTVFCVPSIVRPINHKENIKYLTEQYEAALNAWRRATVDYRIEGASEQAARCSDALVEYSKHFKLAKPKHNHWTNREAVLAYRAEREKRTNTPANIAKRAKAQAAREAKRARAEELKRANEAERVVAWLSGELDHYHTGYGVPALLRVKGDELQTSQGATVPLDHAVRAFRLILAVKQRGETWETNGHRIPVGHFQVERIEPTGDIKAGCHVILWPEIERIAKALELI